MKHLIAISAFFFLVGCSTTKTTSGCCTKANTEVTKTCTKSETKCCAASDTKACTKTCTKSDTKTCTKSAKCCK